jgi:hypothetical protein
MKLTDKERLDKIEAVMNDPKLSNKEVFGEILKIMENYNE